MQDVRHACPGIWRQAVAAFWSASSSEMTEPLHKKFQPCEDYTMICDGDRARAVSFECALCVFASMGLVKPPPRHVQTMYILDYYVESVWCFWPQTGSALKRHRTKARRNHWKRTTICEVDENRKKRMKKGRHIYLWQFYQKSKEYKSLIKTILQRCIYQIMEQLI